MSEWKALVAAVCAQSEDDTVRLACADWLDEHDQPECAEFIRVQVDLARLPPGISVTVGDTNFFARKMAGKAREVVDPHYDRREALRRRERELLDAYGASWATGPLAPRTVRHIPIAHVDTMPDQDGVIWESYIADERWHFKPEFRRGFIDHVTCTAADWLAHADAIRAAHPVTRVTLTTDIYAGHEGDHPYLCLALGNGGEARYTTKLTEYPQLTGDHTADMKALLESVFVGITFTLPPLPEPDAPWHPVTAQEMLRRLWRAANR